MPSSVYLPKMHWNHSIYLYLGFVYSFVFVDLFIFEFTVLFIAIVCYYFYSDGCIGTAIANSCHCLVCVDVALGNITTQLQTIRRTILPFSHWRWISGAFGIHEIWHFVDANNNYNYYYYQRDPLWIGSAFGKAEV